MNTQKKRTVIAALFVGTLFIYINTASARIPGAIYTTIRDGTVVNQNIYGMKEDVYLSGGPQNQHASGLPDGTYYFQITDPSGHTLLSPDPAVCRQLLVSSGRVAGSTGPACKHMNGTFNVANGTLPVQMAPFSDTPNPGMEYKAWLVPVGSATIGTDGMTLNFSRSDAKTDNFKVQAQQVQQGECAPSSSLSVLVSGTDVIAYVPKGCWSCSGTGVSVVNIEGTSITDTFIPTGSDVINSCASNSTTGQTVCTANNANVYVLRGTALDPAVIPNPLTSSGSGSILFSGGSCTNCGVAMDATHNRASIGLSIGGIGGFQFLNLAGTVTNASFEPAFASMAPAGVLPSISEDALIDPIRNLLLSPNENNNYEIVNVAITTSPSFFENPIPNPVPNNLADSSAEDCSTGIALAPYEFSSPSQVFVADLSSAIFTPGSPGSWTSLSALNTLTESLLNDGASGIAVAQGTHTGIVSGEFGGDAITAIALPPTSGVVLLPDWVTCNIGGGFTNGRDPHTVTAYQSPNPPAPNHAFALLANFGASTIAVVDLTNMLDQIIVPRTSGTGLGHACLAGPLPAAVVRFVSVP